MDTGELRGEEEGISEAGPCHTGSRRQWQGVRTLYLAHRKNVKSLNCGSDSVTLICGNGFEDRPTTEREIPDRRLWKHFRG